MTVRSDDPDCLYHLLDLLPLLLFWLFALHRYFSYDSEASVSASPQQCVSPLQKNDVAWARNLAREWRRLEREWQQLKKETEAMDRQAKTFAWRVRVALSTLRSDVAGRDGNISSVHGLLSPSTRSS